MFYIFASNNIKSEAVERIFYDKIILRNVFIFI